MKYYFFRLVSFIFALYTLVSCRETFVENIIGKSQNTVLNTEFKKIQIINRVNLEDIPENISLSGSKILTLSAEEPIDVDGTSKITTFEGYLPQVLMLVDSNEKLLMISRKDFHEGDINEMSIRSTAIALVTMHPALSGVKSHVYSKLEEIIINTSSFSKLEYEIAESLKKGQACVHPDNSSLITALNSVFEQVVAATEEEATNGGLPNLDPNTRSFTGLSCTTRASELKGVTTIAGINVGPFHVTTSGSKVVFENYSLTPFYSGKVTHHNQTDNFDIPSGGDRGVSFFFDNTWGSEKVEYPFTREGEYQFFFDKTTAESYSDQAIHTFCNVLEVLGLPLEKKWLFKTANDLTRYMVARGFDIVNFFGSNKDGWAITRVLYGLVVDYVKDGNLEKILIEIGIKEISAECAQKILKNISGIYTAYESCRGTINIVMRFVMRLQSPDNVIFGLYYYQGEITTATKASLAKYSGDGQRGLVGRRLNEPIRVKVTTIGSDGSLVVASNFHRVKFKIDEGNGIIQDEIVATDPDGYAQTFWTLDPENTEIQYLKAVVIDIVTGEEISDDVIFTATPVSTADVTFTLDWHPTDINCDIDLHVYDPQEHHIWYSEMSCACGGYLDRDDRHGPGPEHIYYAQVNPGKYHVYVHHYESDTKGTVGFSVTTEYGEKRFVNRSSVEYHEHQYIGTLVVEGDTPNSVTRSKKNESSIQFYYDENAPVFPIDIFPSK